MTTTVDTLVKIIDRLTKQPGALSVRGVEALERIGETLMDGLQPFRDAIDRQTQILADTLTTEIGQIADKLGNVVNVADVQMLADELNAKTDAFAEQIRNIVPDTPAPEPEPEPEPEPTPEP